MEGRSGAEENKGLGIIVESPNREPIVEPGTRADGQEDVLLGARARKPDELPGPTRQNQVESIVAPAGELFQSFLIPLGANGRGPYPFIGAKWGVGLKGGILGRSCGGCDGRCRSGRAFRGSALDELLVQVGVPGARLPLPGFHARNSPGRSRCESFHIRQCGFGSLLFDGKGGAQESWRRLLKRTRSWRGRSEEG